jgi:hypothetical protein
MAENTFDFLIGEEKGNEMQISCSLFFGDFTAVIGSLPKVDDMGISKLFFVVFFAVSAYVLTKMTKNNSWSIV